MHVTLALLIIVAVVGVASAVARRYHLSAPLLLVVLGLISSFITFIPDIDLEPDLVLIGILPPLLYGAAVKTSLIDFQANRRPIGLLSIGYVLFTTLTIGFLAHLLLPEIGWAAAFALGAVVAPPDAVAATAVARKVGLPRRLLTILEGESLVNDATALVCLSTAVGAIASKSLPAWYQVSGQFLVTAGGGVVVGVAVAFVVIQIRKRTVDVVLNVTLSLATPYIAFVPAEEIRLFGAHFSGVLAVVVAGLIIGHKSPAMPSGASRVSERTNWSTVEFLLENSVFLLIGLQVKKILVDADHDSLGGGRVILACTFILLAVLFLRPVWVFPATYVPRLIPAVRRAEPRPPWQLPAVLSWAGMRGVVTLAAVFGLPDVPEIHLPVIKLAALVVVAGTLALQGLTLAALVRKLGLRGPDPREDRLQNAAVMKAATDAGLAELDRINADGRESPDVIEMVRRRSEERGQAAWERLGRSEQQGPTPSRRYVDLRLSMLQVERDKVLELRDSGTVAQDVLRDVLVRLDIEESLLDGRLADDDEETPESELTTPAVLTDSMICDHFRGAPDRDAPEHLVCLDCEREGTVTVHYRMCLSCGNVGCCDSSVGRHAERHFHDAGHPVMRSVEPGEAWRWCYVDELLG